MAKKPVMLMILDGWGIGKPSPTNAVTCARTPNLDALFKQYPHTELACSGEAVGLPAGQMGNSEVGHMNIGAGRIVYQELTRITKAIKEGAVLTNPVLVKTMQGVKARHTKLHFMGLLSDGGVHSHIEHLYGLLAMAKKEGVEEVYIHAFLDGRDTPPQSAAGYLQQLEEKLQELGIGRIATVSGRFYAMDRDKRWERLEKAYNALTRGEGEQADSALAGVEASYAAGIKDEFVVPFTVKGVNGKISAGDGVIFYNFRPDRAREMTRALVDEKFPYFTRCREAFPVDYVCMTQYDATIKAPIAFPPASLTHTLGEVVAEKGLKQLRIAETEKYAHVTFFLNGGVEKPNPGEDRELIPSPKVATYDLQPEMSAYIVTEHLLAKLAEDKYDVVVLNFANPDMLGHTGILAAAVKGLEVVDECVGRIIAKLQELGGTVCVTADHGNLEKMEDEVTHAPFTAHTTNNVPFILVDGPQGAKLHSGSLCDIAPTLLELLHVDQPAEMTGHSLIIRD